MTSLFRMPRLTTAATLTALPALALAHTGSDGGGHHNFLDQLLYALSDLSVPALVVALGIWGAMLLTHRTLKQRQARSSRARATRPRDL
jgi:hydrogenase/urease accessory protein HupE